MSPLRSHGLRKQEVQTMPLSQDQLRRLKEEYNSLSGYVWRASQGELLAMIPEVHKRPDRFVHLLSKQQSLVCQGGTLTSFAHSTLSQSVKLAVPSPFPESEMVLVTSTARRATCALCVYTLNADMKAMTASCKPLFAMLAVIALIITAIVLAVVLVV